VVDHDLEQVADYYIEDNINLEEILKVAQQLSRTTYKATYKEVEYLISLDTSGQLQKIVYTDNLDNGVKIIFKNMNYDATIEDAKLECHAPKDYDIIKG
jgi:NAD-dependent SIR2 family protein deacetylase